MATVSLASSTLERFVNRLHDAFEQGDDEVASKTVEADNVRRLQEQYRAIAGGDFAPVIATMAEDIEMEFIGPPGTPLTGKWRGRQEVAEAVRNNFAQLEDQQAEILEVVAQGDTVVLFGHESGRLRATGKPYDMHWVQFFTFRNGKVCRLRSLCDTAAFLDAAWSA